MGSAIEGVNKDGGLSTWYRFCFSVLGGVAWDYVGIDQRCQEIPVLYKYYLIVMLDYLKTKEEDKMFCICVQLT